MSAELQIEQLWLTQEPRIAGKSPGVDFALEEAALKLAAEFGPTAERGLFAIPLTKSHVAVTRFDPAFGLHFLILPTPLYAALGNPFAIAEKFPIAALANELDTLAWPAEPLPQRSVTALNEMMKTGDGPLWLAAAQALIDGSRICLNPATAEASLRAIWQLLPHHSRGELWPATSAPADGMNFSIFANAEPVPAGCLSEEQARDYPEGRYELALQAAIESGDQNAVDRLFARRSSREILRLAMFMLLGAVIFAAGFKLMKLF